MIAFGVAAVKRFQWITVVFAAILLVSSYKLLVEQEDEDHDLSQNTLVRWVVSYVEQNPTAQKSKLCSREEFSGLYFYRLGSNCPHKPRA